MYIIYYIIFNNYYTNYLLLSSDINKLILIVI